MTKCSVPPANAEVRSHFPRQHAQMRIDYYAFQLFIAHADSADAPLRPCPSDGVPDAAPDDGDAEFLMLSRSLPAMLILR